MLKTSSKSEVVAALGRKCLFYVCREAERAMSLANQPGCFIVTNFSTYAQQAAKNYSNIILIKDKELLDTWQLLRHPKIKKLIRPKDFILVFKNTSQIEKICQENKWRLLNPSASLSSQVEEKISQIRWLGPLQKYLPPFKVDICENIRWTGKIFILQFNRTHTGSGTMLIKSKKDLENLQQKFPKREVKITDYISGPFFTNNNIVWDKKVLTGNISYQITGLPPYTDNPFATIGNDWAWPAAFLTPAQIKNYKKIATDVGQRLAKNGWRGLYGIDTVLDGTTGQLYLIEINCRQPASTTLESELQLLTGKKNQKNITTFDAHLMALLKIKNNSHRLIKINDGAQIIQRILLKKQRKVTAREIKKYGNLRVIEYNNTALGADLVRLQSQTGIIQTHNVLKKI